jgi:hypothetical protein
MLRVHCTIQRASQRIHETYTLCGTLPFYVDILNLDLLVFQLKLMQLEYLAPINLLMESLI